LVVAAETVAFTTFFFRCIKKMDWFFSNSNSNSCSRFQAETRALEQDNQNLRVHVADLTKHVQDLRVEEVHFTTAFDELTQKFSNDLLHACDTPGVVLQDGKCKIQYSDRPYRHRYELKPDDDVTQADSMERLISEHDGVPQSIEIFTSCAADLPEDCGPNEIYSELGRCVPKPWSDFMNCAEEVRHGACPLGNNPNSWVGEHCAITCVRAELNNCLRSHGRR
jgi:hypothetical protein